MFSNLFSSSISLATVTPSLVTVGAPHDFSITTLRPRGPSVIRTALASRLSPLAISPRAPEEKISSLAAIVLSFWICVRFPRRGRSTGERRLEFVGSVEHGEEVVLAHDQVLFAVDLDLGAAVLAEQHAVAGLDLERDDLAVLVALARADSDHLGLDRLLLRRVRDEQTTGGLGLLFETLDQNSIM